MPAVVGQQSPPRFAHLSWALHEADIAELSASLAEVVDFEEDVVSDG